MAKAKNKKNLFKLLTEFIEGIKNEVKKIMWPSKKKWFKYSVVTITFVLFFCVFFIVTSELAMKLVALISYVKELIG